MFKSVTLQNRLIGSFILMGGIVLTVGLVGWNGSNRLSEHITTLGKNSVPSIAGLWKINEGQTQVQSSMRALNNPKLDQEDLKVEEERIQEAWNQINDGFKEYNLALKTPDEEEMYKNKFLPNWDEWKQNQEEFLKNFEVAYQDRQISDSEMNRMDQFLAKKERTSFNATAASMLKLLKINESTATSAIERSQEDINQISRWVLLGMLTGPAAALIFGIYFSITIARPLAGKIAGIVNTIASSSTEIVATVEQQERTVTEQATAVNQTTTTMDELGASSRQSAEQAEAAANSAQQVLLLVDGRSLTNSINNHNSSLRDKVGQIADQILRLSEQTGQIGIISNLVSELANQTNMLALNAAVEAVRAGEHGKGFGVVATEIRKLADQSKKSAERINGLVMDVQNATNTTVMVTDEGTKTVEGIVSAINNIVLNSQQISLTAKQQAIAIQQVVDAMNAINQSTSQTAAGISQARVSTQRLNDAATTLKSVV